MTQVDLPYKISLELGYTIRLAEENDTKIIVDFVNKQINNEENYFNVIGSKKEDYDEITIRHNLYQCIEDFILLEKDQKVYGMLIFAGNITGTSKALMVNAVFMEIYNEELLKHMFDFAHDILPEYSIIEPIKLRVQLEKKECEYFQKWSSAFKKSGFKEEILRENELGMNRHILTLIRNMD